MMKKLLSAIVCMASALVANAQEPTDISTLASCMYTEPAEIMAGCTKEVEINVKNALDVQAIGFYMDLPAGIDIALDEDDEPDWYLDFSRIVMKKGIPQHAFANNKVAGTWRGAITTATGANIIGNDGSLIIMNLKADDNATPGNYLIKFSNIEFSNINGKLPVADGTLTVYCKLTIKGGSGVEEVAADKDNLPTKYIDKATKRLVIKKGAQAVGVDAIAQ